MDIVENTIREKINSKADQLKISRGLLFSAIESLVASRIKVEDKDRDDDIETEILRNYILDHMENSERSNYEDLQSSDINQVRKAALLNDYLTEELIDKLPISDAAKEILRVLDDPKKIHAVSIASSLSDIDKAKKKYKTIAKLASEKAGEEIDLMYRSMEGKGF